MSELKPCPFCGGAGRCGEGDGKWFAHCEAAGCYAYVGENYDASASPDHMFESQEEAREAWNRRVPVVELPPLTATPIAWLDEQGRIVQRGEFRNGGWVSADRAIPDSWKPLYLAAPVAPARDAYTMEQIGFALRKSLYAKTGNLAIEAIIEDLSKTLPNGGLYPTKGDAK